MTLTTDFGWLSCLYVVNAQLIAIDRGNGKTRALDPGGLLSALVHAMQGRVVLTKLECWALTPL